MNSCLPESSACRRLTRSEHVQLLVSMSGVVSSFPQYPPVADTTITHSVMLPGITRYPEITKRGYHLVIKRADIINLVHIMGKFHVTFTLFKKKCLILSWPDAHTPGAIPYVGLCVEFKKQQNKNKKTSCSCRE